MRRIVRKFFFLETKRSLTASNLHLAGPLDPAATGLAAADPVRAGQASAAAGTPEPTKLCGARAASMATPCRADRGGRLWWGMVHASRRDDAAAAAGRAGRGERGGRNRVRG